MNIQRHRMRRLIFLLALALALLAACAQPSASVPPATGGEPETHAITMRLQWFPQYQFAGYIVAKVKGYYDEVGLDVTINPGGPDFVSLPLVASGADTFGSTGADTILIARAKGIDIVALATWFQTSPVAFMVHRDSGIFEPQDFEGKTVGMFYGDNVETEYRALIAATDVDRARVNEVPGEFNLEPFLSRRVDVWPVYATDQPDLARQQGADIRLIFARDYGVNLMGDTLFTTESFVRENPNTTRAFVEATLRGWEYATTHVDETLAIIVDYNSELDLDHLRFEANETIELLRYGSGERCLGWSNPAAWEAEQQLLVDLDVLAAPVAIDAAIDNRSIEAFYQSSGVVCSAK